MTNICKCLKTTGNDSDAGYRFHLTNSKTFLASTRNCHLKIEPWQKEIMD